uniref:Small nuclear RNA activating complex, polypeptide 4 n=1 Tax=Iconisemion striatum TaxID=60296 RepID=A0A1A7XI37_9TELE
MLDDGEQVGRRQGMSVSLSAERDRIQRQVEELQQQLSVDQTELDLLSSETDDVSDSEDEQDEVGQCAASLLAQKKKIQMAIQNLEDILGPHSPLSLSSGDSSSSDESDLGLSESVDSCLQVNLVYQQVIQETLDHLETLLTHNQTQQRDILSQIYGPVKEESRERPTSSLQHPPKMFLGSFLKPYFKDKLTGLGPPANQEARLRAQRMAGCPNEKTLRTKRWESWQKILLFHSVSRDSLRRFIQPKLSRVDYLTQKMFTANEEDQLQLRKQMEGLEKEIDLLSQKKEDELIGGRYEEHDWQKISNIDFEGTKEAEDIRLFWENFLHPSINKMEWSKEEVQQLKIFQRSVSTSLTRSFWIPEEDNQLRYLVDKMRIGNYIPYTQISYFMEGRVPNQLFHRWVQVLDPSLKKGMWTKEEDQLLLKAVSRHGECWWKIRLEVPGRSDTSCRDRYMDCLRKDIKRGSFTKDEKELLKNLVDEEEEEVNENEKMEITEGKEDVDSDEDRQMKKAVEEEEYVIPLMKEWIPEEKSETISSLNFRPAVLSLPSSSPDGKCVRSTVVDKSGSSVMFGAPPRVLRWDERHNSDAMMMVSRFQLINYLALMEQKSTALSPGSKMADRSMDWKLQAAVTPWIGNLLFKKRRRKTVADVLRETLESCNISISSAFLLFLQAMNVDVVGCKEMILQREKKVAHQAPPPAPSPVGDKNKRKTAVLLQKGQRLQPSVKQLCVLMQVPRHPTPRVFLLPPPTSQPTVASPSFLNIRPLPTGAPQPAPPFSAVSTLPTTTPVLIPLAPPLPQAIPLGSTVNSDCTILPSSSTSSSAPSPTLPPPTWREQREAATCSSQSMVAGTGVDGAQRDAQPEAMRASSSSEMDHTQKTSSAPHPPAASTFSSSSAGSLSLATPTSIIAMDHNYIAVDNAPKDSDSAPRRTAKAERPKPPDVPRDPVFNSPLPSYATPTCQLMPVPRSHDLIRSQSNPPLPELILPYKGVIKVDSVKAPPLRMEKLQFNPALMFPEPTEEVCGWLSGHGGVAVSGARSALPYLPPFCSTLSRLGNLLCTKRSLMTSSLLLLNGANDLPDSTSNGRAAEDQPAPTISPSQEEEEQVELLRQMVAERYSSNPAYQLLKARFLSCFTLPALLATMQPVTKKSHSANQEEDEDDEQLKKIQERGRKRMAERSLLLSDDLTASANHFSGIKIINKSTTDPEQVPQNQLPETGPDQTGSEQEHKLSLGLSGSTSDTS